jgi:hypothetical protein
MSGDNPLTAADKNNTIHRHASQLRIGKPFDPRPASNVGSDACSMTASQIMLHRAIVLREGQFLRAHTFVV